MNEWFFAKGGQQNGPVTLEQLRQLARTGGLDPKDLVWNSTMKDWAPAGQMEGLFHAAAETVAPVPDPSSPDVALPEIAAGSEPLDPAACIKRGFELTKRQFGNILLVGLTWIGISIAVAVIMGLIDSALGIGGTSTYETWISESERGSATGFAANSTMSPSILNSIVTNIVSIFLGLGLTRVGLNLVSGKAVTVGMLFGEGNKLLRAIGASILFGLMVFFGILLLVVPGIYLALRYGQFMAAIVDRDMGVMDAFSYSSSLTMNNKLQLFVLWLLSMLVILAGMLACGVGLIFASPVVWLATLVAYRWMQYGHRAAMDQPGTQTPMLGGQ